MDDVQNFRTFCSNFAKSLKSDSFSVSLAAPLPGTKMWDICEKNNLFIEDEVDKPESKQGHVVIEVKASSLNPVDHKLLRADLGINPSLPGTVHMDVAGVVTEVGESITDFKFTVWGFESKQLHEVYFPNLFSNPIQISMF